MGTRHLIAVVVDGEYKIAQYGQWDGYPSGQGAKILAFLQSPYHHLGGFKEKCRRLRWITDEEIEEVEKNENWFNDYPWLSRDAGSDILQYVYDMDQPFTLQNQIEFAQDGLFCEWAYVLDLDNEKLEVYTGFHKEPVLEGRFAGPMTSGHNNEYGPVQHKWTFSFDALRTLDADEFVKTLDPPEEEET